MNLQEIVTIIRDYVDEPADDESDWNDRELIRYVNLEHRHLISVLRQTYEDYLGREHIFAADTNLYYFLPKGLVNLRRVELLQGGVTGSPDNYAVDENTVRIEDVDQVELNNKEVGAIASSTSRIRSLDGYYLWNNQIRFTSSRGIQNKYARLYYYPSVAELHYGTAVTGSTNTITLALPSALTTFGNVKRIKDYYKDMLIEIVSGTGEGQIGLCTAYDGSTRVATMSEDWDTTPDATSVYSIVSPIVEDYQELLSLGAARRAKGIKTEDDVSVLSEQYNMIFAEMKSSLEARNIRASRKVKISGGNN